MFVLFSMKRLSGRFHYIYIYIYIYIYGNYIFTIDESVLNVSCYYTVVEVILKIDATKSLGAFPLCLTYDPLVLSKLLEKLYLPSHSLNIYRGDSVGDGL